MMKRTNLIIDDVLLKDAKRVLEVETYSAAVNMALTEIIRWKNVGSLSEMFGKGIWSGDLSAMREDKPPRDKSKRRA